ncbi:hypothetical protein ACFQW6_00760 [Nocardioides sp. GCM10028917]|uniref:hypothetical protein n=1 Tax=Nocardioides sp. GCM10028917 TaxID=3273408 RepID=UPI003614197F
MPSSSFSEPVPWPPTSVPVDLAAAAVAFTDSRARDATPTAGRYRRIVQQIEQQPRPIHDVPPALPLGCLDGVQARALLGRLEHKEITLAWTSAGTVHGLTLLDHQPRLAVICSQLDEKEVRTRAPQLPVVALPESTPWGLATLTDEWIDQARRHVEDLAVAAAPKATGKVLVVDGPLLRSSDRDDVVGVVKTHQADWLPDPDLIPTKAGWRSPGLRLPASRTTDRNVHTAYVRLHTATSHHSYGHALIRIEVYEDSTVTLDAAAAMVHALRGRQSSGDPRWAIQLNPMFEAENVLKAQIPHVIRTLR